MSRHDGEGRGESPARRPRVKRLRRIAIIVSAVVAGLLIVAAAIVGAAVCYLSPGRLTPMVNRYASEYLIADVEARRVEIGFWRSFPKLTLRIDSLSVTSRALDGLDATAADSLPPSAAHLLDVDRISGAVDIVELVKGRIRLHDVEIRAPRVNLVKVTDSIANYLIVPPSESDGATSVPDITIDRFAITGDATVRFRSLADSTDVTGRLVTSLTRSPGDMRLYAIDLKGSGGGSLGGMIDIGEMPFGIDGRIGWSAADPYELDVEDMAIKVGGIDMTVDAHLDMADTLAIERLLVRMEGARFADLRELVPGRWRGELDRIDADLAVDLTATLTAPYLPARDSLPSVRLAMDAEGWLEYDRLAVRELEAGIEADIDGREPDRSVVTIRRLKAIGRALGFNMTATVTTPFSDPRVEGTFSGGIDFAMLPRRLCSRMGIDIEGMMTADAGYDFRLSHLSAGEYHRIRLEGDMGLRRFRASMRDSSMTLFAARTRLKFGTGSRLRLPTATIDSMLTLSLSADTIAAVMDKGAVVLSSTGLKAGVGMRNVASSFDTTRVNPIGARITADRMFFRSLPDSMTTRVTDVSAIASVTRYKGNVRVPRMRLGLDARRIRYTDPYNRAALSGGHFDLSVHLRELDTAAVARRAARAADSTRVARRARRAALDSLAVVEGRAMDISVDRSLSRWLRRLSAQGSLTATRGRLMSRFFPLVARTSGLGLRFTTDSIMIDSITLSTGSTSMRLAGMVTNISRAVSSVRQPIRASFDIDADTLDINEIAGAVFAGADFARNLSVHTALGDDDDDEAVSASIAHQADSSSRHALVVPSNIDASLRLRAANVLYSDIWFQRIEGNVDVTGGAVHLDRLAGYTPIGSIDLSALYSAPQSDSIRFAAGIVIRRLHLNRFLQLMPQIDSLMPLLRDVDGIVTADMAMSTELDSLLDFRFHTLDAVMRLSGDSLSLADPKKFEKVARLLRFKHRDRIVIDHMDVELMVSDSKLDLFPFVFDIDRYKFGVSGSNDLGLNLDYHIAVLKSPIPFRFGVNIKGRPGHIRFSLGRAHFDENKAYARRQLTDTARINLIEEIEHVFRFGVSSGRRNVALERMQRPDASEFSVADTLTHADSLLFIREGVIEVRADTVPGHRED